MKEGIFTAWILAICIAILVTGWAFAVVPEHHRPRTRAVEVGRYQLSGDWRLDTATGEVERVVDVYQQQNKPVAKFGYKCSSLSPGLEPPKK